MTNPSFSMLWVVYLVYVQRFVAIGLGAQTTLVTKQIV